jgi:hypothetical protein
MGPRKLLGFITQIQHQLLKSDQSGMDIVLQLICALVFHSGLSTVEWMFFNLKYVQNEDLKVDCVNMLCLPRFWAQGVWPKQPAVTLCNFIAKGIRQ